MFIEQNQHIRMISEGLCDTEDWNKDWKFSFLINYTLKYSSQHLKWINTGFIGQLWWKVLIHFKCWLVYIKMAYSYYKL